MRDESACAAVRWAHNTRALSTRVLVAIACFSAVCGQSKEASLSAAREAYSSSMDIWMALQQDLPIQIRRLPSADALAKMQTVEKARSAVGKARRDYLNLIKDAYTAAASRYEVPDHSKSEAGAMIEITDKELLSDLDQVISRLDEEIRSSAATDRPRAAGLQKQKTELLDLKSLVLRRGRDLDRYEAELSQFRSGRQALNRAYLDLAGWVASAAEAADRDDARWTAAYSRLRAQIESRPVERPVSKLPEAPPPAQPVTTPIVPSAQAAVSALVPNISGLWVLNNPRARKLPSGAYEPASARLEITQTGPEVSGSYECSFAVPENESYNPVVRFNFAGRITNPILRFDIKAPLAGTILIRQGAAGTLEVSYGIRNPQKAGIDFGLVPDDGPQVLSRAVR